MNTVLFVKATIVFFENLNVVEQIVMSHQKYSPDSYSNIQLQSRASLMLEDPFASCGLILWIPVLRNM